MDLTLLEAPNTPLNILYALIDLFFNPNQRGAYYHSHFIDDVLEFRDVK